jgi:hypothetical protein
MGLKDWLDKGEGGEWYESYLTNRDLLTIGLYVLLGSGIIVLGCWMI